MESIHHLRQKILKELPRLWNQSATTAEKYVSHTWHLPPIELSSLVPLIPSKVIGFWRSPKGKKDILSLLPLKSFGNSSCFNQMEQLLEGNTQLTFFGGQHFTTSNSPPSYEWAGFGNHHYFLPALCFETSSGKTTLTITWPREIAKNSVKQADFIFHIKQAFDISSTQTNSISIENSTLICSLEKWNELVDTALENIQSGSLEKVVLARKQIVNLSGQSCARNIFERALLNNSHNSYACYLQISPDTAFISMTPEKLFEIRGNEIKTDALAGTRSRGKNPTEDTLLEKELLQSPKEIHEHNLVVSFLKNKMKQLSIDPTPHSTQILKLPHVQHLWTPLEGTVPSASIDVGKLVSHFHPTPGVAGWPTDEALNFLKEQERFERGFYSAPIGIIQKDYAHFAVAIRSALVYHNRLHLYAGAGIVKNSKGDEEWKETQNKMKTFQEIF